MREKRIMWSLVALGFLLMISAWGVLFYLASKHPVERIEVPSHRSK